MQITPATANGRGSLLPNGDASDNYWPRSPPPSTTIKCIVNLSSQFFIVYSGAFFVRKYNDLNGIDNNASMLAKTLERCKDTCFFCPMLSVMFLGVRMRSNQLTQNSGAPPEYVQLAMMASSFAVLAQALLIFGQAFFLSNSKLRSQPVLILFDVVEKLALLALYGGAATVVQGALTMTPETCGLSAAEAKEIFGGDGAPKVSPAVLCVIILSTQFFLVFTGIKVIETWEKYVTDPRLKPPALLTWKATLDVAKATVAFAPQLSILFIAARFRALQIDPVAGAPQPWAQQAFFACTGSVFLQLILVLIGPLAGISVKQNPAPGAIEGDLIYESSNKNIQIVLEVVRYALVLAMYAGFSAVIYSILTLKNEDGPTPGMAPAVVCVLNLTCQYFGIYLALMIGQTVEKLAGISYKKVMNCLTACIDTVRFAPMVCCVCIAARMRASEITDGEGAPPGWVMDAMFVASYAILAQLICCVASYTVLPPTEQDGKIGGVDAPLPLSLRNEKDAMAEKLAKQSKELVLKAVSGTFSAMQLFGLFGLHGSTIAIIFGLFTMHEANSNGEGSRLVGVLGA